MKYALFSKDNLLLYYQVVGRMKLLIHLTVFYLISQGLLGQVQKGGHVTEIFEGGLHMPDKNTVAYTARYSGVGPCAFIYTWNGNDWVQKGDSIPPVNTSDHSDGALSMGDANTVAIGYYNNSDVANQAGHVRIFGWTGTTWVQKGTDIDGTNNLENFGYSVSMPDANTVAVGAPRNNSSTGKVQVFQWDGSGWIPKGNVLTGDSINYGFGHSVHMPNPSTLAVGGPGALRDTPPYFKSGATKIYNWDGMNWVQKGSTLFGDYEPARFGSSVNMFGSNHVAVGAPSSFSGYVRVFAWDGTDWYKKGPMVDHAGLVGLPSHGVGESVAMGSPNDLIISSKFTSGHPIWAQAFEFSDDSLWITKGYTHKHNSNTLSRQSVAMPDSNTFAIFATAPGGASLTTIGQLRVYNHCVDIHQDFYHSSCYPFTWVDGVTYTSSNSTATFAVAKAGDCDSILHLNFTLNQADATILNNHPSYTAATNGAIYHWLDCNNNFTPLPGETSQTFIAQVNGSFALQVIENGCADTSQCFQVPPAGFEGYGHTNTLNAFPNPTKNKIHLFFEDLKLVDAGTIEVRNTLGQLLLEQKFSQAPLSLDLSQYPNGLYFISYRSESIHSLVKVIKE